MATLFNERPFEESSTTTLKVSYEGEGAPMAFAAACQAMEVALTSRMEVMANKMKQLEAMMQQKELQLTQQLGEVPLALTAQVSQTNGRVNHAK